MIGATAGGGALVSRRVLFGGQQAAEAAPSSEVVEDSVATACWIGKQDCGMLARRLDGRVIKFEGNPAHPGNRGTLCAKGVAQIMALYDPNRLRAPLVRTNGKGVQGTWRQVSWDQALAIVGERIKEIRRRDPELLLWQVGRSKSRELYNEAFVRAAGATMLGHGAYGAGAGYRASEYTTGLSGVLHPDFRHTRYLFAWGWNVTNAGGNKLCSITWNRELVDARERGLKLVAIDPRLRGAGPFADEWLPIRPGTDLALALAFANILLEQGYVDREYLERYTNAPFLVGEDGSFLRVGDKEQVWDPVAGGPRAYDARVRRPALEGEYEVGGGTVKPAFQLFKEHVARYTPAWAAEVTGVPEEMIRHVAEELGESAQIGSTIEVEGLRLPYRPVAAMAYHMTQQELGFQAVRAILAVFMLVGAVGAVGGQRVDFAWDVDRERFESLDWIEIKDPPYDFALAGSKFFPINSGNPSVAAMAARDAAKYGVEKLPEMVIVHMHNPLVSAPDQKLIADFYGRFKFVVVVSPWLSETADHFADVVLPAATLEKYEGPLPASDGYTDAVALRTPPMAPLFQSRGEVEIYLDLSEKAGILYGRGGYLDQVNRALGLTRRHALSLSRKPTAREIFDRWARSQGIKEGVAFFEKRGVKVKGPIPATRLYGYATDPPFGGVRHRLYGESLLRYRRQMKAKGAEEGYWRDYTALPTWRTPTMERSPADYDLYLISYKLAEHKQTRSSFIPLLAEQAPEQRLAINPETAEERGIDDGDEVWVESHNAVTGETRRVKVRAAYSNAIRPDTVGMSHHFGLWAHPGSRERGPSPNEIFFSGEGYLTNTADQSFQVKVRVFKD